MTVRLVVFDLDGTLIDGYPAIEDALSYAMGRMALPALGAREVRSMVGHGLAKLLEQAVGAARAEEGVRLYRERYPSVCIEKSELLDGAREVLEALRTRGHAIALASNKPASFSRLILDAKGVGHYFSGIGGPDASTPAKPDPTMLLRLIREASGDPESTVVVGDMEVDSEMALAAGCRVLLIPGGSRSREELAGVHADAFLGRLSDLPGWIDGDTRRAARRYNPSK